MLEVNISSMYNLYTHDGDVICVKPLFGLSANWSFQLANNLVYAKN